jgi:hypothetical protein
MASTAPEPRDRDGSVRMDVTSIAAACADLDRTLHAERERQYPAWVYRAISAAIDDACFEVEEVNLGGGGDCPPQAWAVIRYLLLLAGERVVRPSSSFEAHDVLFRLSELLLGRGCAIDPESGATVAPLRGYAA